MEGGPRPVRDRLPASDRDGNLRNVSRAGEASREAGAPRGAPAEVEGRPSRVGAWPRPRTGRPSFRARSARSSGGRRRTQPRWGKTPVGQGREPADPPPASARWRRRRRHGGNRERHRDERAGRLVGLRRGLEQHGGRLAGASLTHRVCRGPGLVAVSRPPRTRGRSVRRGGSGARGNAAAADQEVQPDQRRQEQDRQGPAARFSGVGQVVSESHCGRSAVRRFPAPRPGRGTDQPNPGIPGRLSGTLPRARGRDRQCPCSGAAPPFGAGGRLSQAFNCEEWRARHAVSHPSPPA